MSYNFTRCPSLHKLRNALKGLPPNRGQIAFWNGSTPSIPGGIGLKACVTSKPLEAWPSRPDGGH